MQKQEAIQMWTDGRWPQCHNQDQRMQYESIKLGWRSLHFIQYFLSWRTANTENTNRQKLQFEQKLSISASLFLPTSGRWSSSLQNPPQHLLLKVFPQLVQFTNFPTKALRLSQLSPDQVMMTIPLSMLGKVSIIKCVLFVENSTNGGSGVRSFYKS